jgi:GNAT superfamily N-acetyltransferase
VPDVVVRPASEADVPAIAKITTATGQHDEWGGTNPAYIGHLLIHGRVVVAELSGDVVGFGAVQEIGSPPISMLCDLYVDPAVHGRGCGRAMLADLWSVAPRRMTFSSLHSNAMPLYTSFGLDPWWPLMYLKGYTARLPVSEEWAVESATPAAVAAFELDWTGADRAADHRAWASRLAGESIVVAAGADGEVIAAGAVIHRGPDRGIVHLATAPEAPDAVAAAVVLQSLAHLADEPSQLAHVCLPAPHPAVRALLSAGWRFDEFDLFMASEPELLNPRRAVPSPGQA